MDGCDKKWLPAAMAGLLDYNRQPTASGQPKFPEWALEEIEAWAPEQPQLNSTQYALDGVCCPYGNPYKDGSPMYPDCPPACCNVEAGEAILEALMQDDVNTILVAWEHANAQYLIGT